MKYLEEDWVNILQELIESNISKEDFREFLELKRLEKEENNGSYKN